MDPPERPGAAFACGDRLVALGAVRERLPLAGEDNESCVVMQDIEGNEFCLDRGGPDLDPDGDAALTCVQQVLELFLVALGPAERCRSAVSLMYAP